MAEGPPPVNPNRRKIVIGAVALVAVVAGAWVWRSRRQPATLAVDPATGAIDTGSAYANPSPTRTTSAEDTNGLDGAEVIRTNDDWFRVVSSDLQELGWDPQFIATVLGDYLSGQPLSAAEATLVRTAWASRGHPPQDRSIVMEQPATTNTFRRPTLPAPTPADMPRRRPL